MKLPNNAFEQPFGLFDASSTVKIFCTEMCNVNERNARSKRSVSILALLKCASTIVVPRFTDLICPTVLGQIAMFNSSPNAEFSNRSKTSVQNQKHS